MKIFSFEQFVNESKIVDEALAVSNRGINDNMLLVSINGTEYGYGEAAGELVYEGLEEFEAEVAESKNEDQ